MWSRPFLSQWFDEFKVYLDFSNKKNGNGKKNTDVIVAEVTMLTKNINWLEITSVNNSQTKCHVGKNKKTPILTYIE